MKSYLDLILADKHFTCYDFYIKVVLVWLCLGKQERRLAALRPEPWFPREKVV